MKKTLLISVIYLMAYGAILALIRSELGAVFSLKIFIPATIIFSINLTAILTSLYKKTEDKLGKEQGDGSLS